LIVKICGTPFAGKTALGKHLAHIFEMPFIDLRAVRASLSRADESSDERKVAGAQYEVVREMTRSSPDHFIVEDLFLEYVFNHRIGQPEADSYEILLGVENELTVMERHQRANLGFDRLAYLHMVKLCREKNEKQDFKLRLMTDRMTPEEVAEIAVQNLRRCGLEPKVKEIAKTGSGHRIKPSWLK